MVDQQETAADGTTENYLKPSIELAPGEVVLGTLVGIDEQGKPLVEFFSGQTSESLQALATVGVTPAHIGRQVALLFANGNPQEPIIMGFIHSQLNELLDSFSLVQSSVDEAKPTQSHAPTESTEAQVEDLLVDGERVVIEGKKEVVLKCGDASITLTKAGKILIRGKYLLNRSSGVNRIMGGSVQVN